MKQEVYSMLNEAVIKLLKNSMWDLATCAKGALHSDARHH